MISKQPLGAVSLVSSEGGKTAVRLEKGSARFEAITEHVARIHVSPNETPGEYRSYAVGDTVARSRFELEEHAESITLRTPHLGLEVRRDLFGVTLLTAEGTVLSLGEAFMTDGDSTGEIRVAPADEDYFGLGERMTPLGRRGYLIDNWNTDEFRHHNETTRQMYLSIPFMIASRPGQKSLWAYFLDSSYRSRFDLASTRHDRLDISVTRGDFVLYLMVGQSFAEIVNRYTELTGRHSVPPLWALGYHQSRYSYMSTAESWEVAQEFRERDIPCDSLWYDIDHMDEYRVFTFDPDRFGDVKDHFWGLGELGFKKVVIVDPGVKADPPGIYTVLDEGTAKGYFVKTADGEDFVGPVWPGGTKFPDFTHPDVRKWWGDLHRVYWDVGVDGVWNDMNEPAVLDEGRTVPNEVTAWDDGHGSTFDRMHNVYALFEAQATVEALRKYRPNIRPFVLTRAGCPGIQRFAAVWTGDNTSTWAHLKASIGQLLNLGMSGLGFCGADVGGFSENTTPELLVRWYQLGAFYPLFRNHAQNESCRQEPWAFGDETTCLIRDAVRLRYHLLPLLYQLAHTMSRTGEPILRPLFWHYAGQRAARVTDQFLFGQDLLVAPVVERGARERMVWLPPGTWCDYHTGQVYEGESEMVIAAPLDRIPLFARAGTVIPVAVPVASTEQMDHETLMLEIRLGDEIAGTLYEDDGVSESPSLEHTYRLDPGGFFEMELGSGSRYRRIVLDWINPHTGERTRDIVAAGSIRRSCPEGWGT